MCIFFNNGQGLRTMATRRRHIIRSEKQLAVLASPQRQEVVDVLAELGPVSVSELAATLGRPADALYFHLRALVAAGLVRKSGSRASGTRSEVLYCTVAPELLLSYEPRREANRTAVSAIVRSMLLGIRDFDRAMRSSDVVVSGARRELWALRKTGRVSPERMTGVNDTIRNLVRAVSKPDGKGRLYAITVLLTPLHRRGRTDGRTKAKGQRKP
jgi:DNA-binding transcriptional ArsR family regulator